MVKKQRADPLRILMNKSCTRGKMAKYSKMVKRQAADRGRAVAQRKRLEKEQQQRSDQQQRARNAARGIPYHEGQWILTVGDGNLSFSAALAAQFETGEQIVATVYDSEEELATKYADASAHRKLLEELGATVLCGVDATRLHAAFSETSEPSPKRRRRNESGEEDESNGQQDDEGSGAEEDDDDADSQGTTDVDEQGADEASGEDDADDTDGDSVEAAADDDDDEEQDEDEEVDAADDDSMEDDDDDVDDANEDGDSDGDDDDGDAGVAAGEIRFDRIVFNFPHVGLGIKDMERNVAANQELLVGFFESAPSMLTPQGEVHVTLKSGEPYDRWKVVKLAQRTGLLRLKDARPFDPTLYPGYAHRRTIGAVEGLSKLDNEEISAKTCKTYIFGLAPATSSKPAAQSQPTSARQPTLRKQQAEKAQKIAAHKPIRKQKR